MNGPVSVRLCDGRGRDHRSRLYGYTLVEILVATTLSLLLMGAVVRMFGDVSQGIADSRSMLEAADRLRLTATRLQQDLAGVTVTMSPPRRPENNEGYFEYIEGPVGAAQMNNGGTPVPLNPAVNTQVTPNVADTTVGDFDDILMFTTRSTGRPFVGRANGKRAVALGETRDGFDGIGDYKNVTTIESDVAEVTWFVRGRTLHRRILLICPQFDADTRPGATSHRLAALGFYAGNDISVQLQGANAIPNTLGDVTRREYRFAQQTGAFPYDARGWSWTATLPSGYKCGGYSTISIPTLPTLRECSSANWTAGNVAPPAAANWPAVATVDFWSNATANRLADDAMMTPLGFASAGTRVADDVILTNVIGFDVKAWDPTAGAYVDLGYNNVACSSTLKNGFSHLGHAKSHLVGSTTTARVYDTWSTHYESVGTGLAGDLPAGNGINGFDDAGIDDSGNPIAADGVVDSADELVTSPPYPCPLRGIQVKIRVFEPDSRQIREVTVIQDFRTQ